VDISNDCSFNINYLKNGERIEENLAGYVTSGMVQKMKHNIFGHNEIIFQSGVINLNKGKSILPPFYLKSQIKN